MTQLTRTLHPWRNLTCHGCGDEYLGARGRAEVIPLNTRLLCDGCETYAKAYDDGYRAGVASVTKEKRA